MADRVQYLPMDLVSMLPFRFKGIDEEHLGEIVSLLGEAFGRGYHDGYVRGMTEEHGRQRLKEQQEKAATDEGKASS